LLQIACVQAKCKLPANRELLINKELWGGEPKIDVSVRPRCAWTDTSVGQLLGSWRNHV